jgi:hypothetical protein
MVYSRTKLKSSGDKASPCFKPFRRGKPSDKCLPVQTLLYVSFKHILINLNKFHGDAQLYENTVLHSSLNNK